MTFLRRPRIDRALGRSILIPVALALAVSSSFNFSPGHAAQSVPIDGSVLPFPAEPMKGMAQPRIQDSTMQWPSPPQRLPANAPNILIVLLDDVGFDISGPFGGEVNTPTLSKLAGEGISFTGFNTTSICSPTRAALLTGRNHTRVGSGTIAERAVAFDVPRAPDGDLRRFRRTHRHAGRPPY